MFNNDFPSISLSDPAAVEIWDKFVHNHPEGTPSHLSGWLKCTAETYGFRPSLACFYGQGRSLEGVFPFFVINSVVHKKRLLSLPFSDFGGPLQMAQADNAAMDRIVDSYCAKQYRIEIRGTCTNSKFIRNDYYKRHVCSLDGDIEKIRSNINKRTIQRSIRKAEDAGTVIKRVTDVQGMEAFIRLNRLTRKKHGVPSQPRKWFNQLQKHVIESGNGFIMVAELNKRIVGASIILISGKTIHYKYNASDPEVMHQVSPNHLIVWETIKWGVANGFRALDFGRTAPDNEGLIRYKEMWGTKTVELPYYYYPEVQGISSLRENSLVYQMYSRLWRCLPDCLSEPVSDLIYKYLT